MKITTLLLSLLLCSVLPFGHGISQTVPSCASSNSDDDGDGWGWENENSCIVVTGSAGGIDGTCEDRGDYPWGWNPVTLESCRLDVPLSSNNQTSSSAAQIGFDITGTWSCQHQITTSSFFEPLQNRAHTINDTVEWVRLGASRYAGGSGSCEQPTGSTDPSISKYVFEENGGLTVFNELSFLSTPDCPDGESPYYQYGSPEYSDWSFDGNSLTVNGVKMKEIGFEYKTTELRTVVGSGSTVRTISFPLLNLYIDNANRLSCRNTDSDTMPIVIF